MLSPSAFSSSTAVPSTVVATENQTGEKTCGLCLSRLDSLGTPKPALEDLQPPSTVAHPGAPLVSLDLVPEGPAFATSVLGSFNLGREEKEVGA